MFKFFKRKKKNKKPLNNKQRKEQIDDRSFILYLLFITWGLIIVARILYIQYSPIGTELREKATGIKSFEPRIIKAKRGNILTKDGKVLATTIPLFNIYLDYMSTGIDTTNNMKNYFDDIDQLASKMSKFFGDKSPNEYKQYMMSGYKNKKRYSKITPRRVNYIELKKMLTFPILNRGRYKGGYSLDTLQNRERPYGGLAARTIGRIYGNGTMVGVEGSQDSILSGQDGINMFQKVSGTFWMPVENPINKPAIDGVDVVTTIDIEVQDVAERYLHQQLEENKAKWGTAILLDVKTGEVRAMANLGMTEDSTYYDIYNYAIGRNMEPGSTFKIVSLLALLEDQKMSIHDVIDTGGGVEKVGTATVRDTHGHGVTTIGGMFEVSSNVGFARSIYNSYKHNPREFTDFIHERKFDEPFGFELKGEAAPVIRNPDSKMWSGNSLPMMAYGYEVLLTPLHTLSFYNAIANNGVYVKPRIIKGYSKDGEMLKSFDTDTICPTICSEKVISDIRYTMEQVTKDGTAKILLNPYYRVAGKTGTAQVSQGSHGYHYNGGRNYLATMVGYFPAENPRYSCIVAIEVFHRDGSNSKYYGGSLAGPVFRAIADKVYSQAVDWGNSIERPEYEKTAAITKNENAPTLIIKGGNSQAVSSAAKSLDIPILAPIDSEILVDENLRVSSIDTDINQDSLFIPNLKGVGLRDASYIANKMRLKLIYSGVGSVKSQIPEAGEHYEVGDTLKIELN